MKIKAGVGLTVATGGILTIIAGAAIIGAGSSLILSPLKKRLTGEAITQKDIRQEIVFGSIVGALATPIGLAGTLATKSVSDAVRLRIRNKRRVIEDEQSVESLDYRSLSENEVERGEIKGENDQIVIKSC